MLGMKHDPNTDIFKPRQKCICGSGRKFKYCCCPTLAKNTLKNKLRQDERLRNDAEFRKKLTENIKPIEPVRLFDMITAFPPCLPFMLIPRGK